MTGEITPTDEQQDVIEQVRQGRASLMVSAFAGCAKTSTMKLAAPGVRVPALALAFNKKNQQDLEKALPGQFTTKTMNGLGHQAWARALAGQNLKVDAQKLGKLITQIAKDQKLGRLSTEEWDATRQLVTKAMQAGLVPQGAGPEGLVPDSPEGWAQIATDTGLNGAASELSLELAHDVLVESISLARAGVISYDDQVYCSVMLGGRFPQYPRVFVDEFQDLNMLNHLMVAKCLRPDGLLTAIGDPKQAIYAFRGALTDSMAQGRALRPEWIDLPLATTFRCPKLVVERQQRHVPGFKAWHTNAEGRIEGYFGKEVLETGKHVWSFSDILKLQPAPNAPMAVLCRNNAPLLGLAFKLIRQGIGPVMLGRDLGKGLTALIKKIAPDNDSVDMLLGNLTEWELSETSKAAVQQKPTDYISDRAESIRAVIDGAGARSRDEAIEMVERLFARAEGQITLSTIHKAKGLEWDLVVHLDPWRIPPKWAREDPQQLEQEYNLKYVCETRTKHTLAMANLGEFE